MPRKVLIVEDLVSSGTTVRLLSQLVQSLGGQVIGIGALWRITAANWRETFARSDVPPAMRRATEP